MRYGDRKQHLEVLEVLTAAYDRLILQVPAPSEVIVDGGLVLRYVERTLGQMVLLKFGRIISGLRAVDTLLLAGLLQEQGVIQRTIDDLQGDITFFALALRDNEFTDDHRIFSDSFWDEDALGQPQSVPRKKIRAFIANRISPKDPHSFTSVTRDLYRTYSGFVHGHSVPMMDMYAGVPPRYLLHGAAGTGRQTEYARDASNYFFRSLITAFLVAKIVGDEDLARSLAEATQSLETDV